MRNSEVDNVAEGLMALSDSHCIQNMERPHVSDGQLICGANGVESSVSDLLVMYQAFLAANAEELLSVTVAEHGNPFKQVHTLLAPHIALSDEALSTQSYSPGWVRTVLPGRLGATGINGMYISAMPVVGRGSKPKLIYHHNGSLAAFLSSVILIPDTNSTIVVFTNSLANNDCDDWIGQLILETLIDSPEKMTMSNWPGKVRSPQSASGRIYLILLQKIEFQVHSPNRSHHIPASITTRPGTGIWRSIKRRTSYIWRSPVKLHTQTPSL